MPKPKLYYFATRGAGELTRLLLAYGEVDYDNIRVGFDTWAEIKPSKIRLIILNVSLG